MSSRPKANSKVEHSAAGAVDADGIATTSGTSSHGSGAKNLTKKQRRQRRRSKAPDPAVFAAPKAETTERVDPGSTKQATNATKRPRDARTTQPLRPASEVLSASKRRRRHGVSTLDFLPSLTTLFVLTHFVAVAVLLYLFVL